MSKLISVVEPSDPNSDPHSYHIRILSGEFRDVVYKFGDVSISEDDGEPKLHFSYNIVHGFVNDLPKFQTFIGDRLVEMLEEQLRERAVVYRGGTDES